MRPSVQPPAGVERKAALYARLPGKSKANGVLELEALELSFGGRLYDLGQPDRQLGAFPDQIGTRTGLIRRFPGPLQALKQDFHVLAEQPLPEPGVQAGADQFVL